MIRVPLPVRTHKGTDILPCKRPCTRRVLDLFRNIQRHELTGPDQSSNTMVTELSPIQREVFGLLGVPTRPYGRPTRA